MKSIKFLSITLFLVIISSCIKEKKEIEDPNISSEVFKKKNVEEILVTLNQRQIIDSLDLSNQNLDVLPDLSKYQIKVLNISYNYLDSIPLNYLPKKIEKLKANNNRIKLFEIFNSAKSFGLDLKSNNTKINLNEIDLSYNKLTNFNISFLDQNCKLEKINISNNELVQIQISCSSVRYLNISNNIKLSNEIDIDINIDTIIRNNIKNNLPIKKLLPKPRERKPVY
ncbi:hypothetical protein ACFSX9_13575 [Flavobacterium ardleyense]|uniref:Uncharacterized protein n=1 Tax=Flavobacterium ardleyense TaxID=2038737 RepID=A0ABW5ZAU4_9FLAO